MSNTRYDRQLRLWGPDGQERLSGARICCIGGNVVNTEILKSLLLPGIGSFTIVDNSVVDEQDISTNFMIPGDALGSMRGQVLLEQLTSLNADVKSKSWLKEQPCDFSEYDIVLAPSISYSSNSSIRTLVVAQSVGFYGRVSIFPSKTHLVIASDSPTIPDYRIRNPWNELKGYCGKGFSGDVDVSHIPFLVQLIKAVSGIGSHQIDRDGLLNRLHAFGDSTCRASQEARDHIYLVTALKRDEEVHANLKTIVETLESVQYDEKLVHDVVLILEAVLLFYEKHEVMPLSVNSLPDMTTHTSSFTELNRLYKEKFLKDVTEVVRLVKQHLHGDKVDVSLVDTIVKNLRQIRLFEINKPEGDLPDEDGSMVEIVDMLDGKTSECISDLSKDFARTTKELHTTSAAVGAVAAQEIIKLLTHKYEPINNTYVLNMANGAVGSVIRRDYAK